jgi:hypothetical protein
MKNLTRVGGSKWFGMLGLCVLLMGVLALAQATWPMLVLYKQAGTGAVVQVRTPLNAFFFDLGNNYPPTRFPTLYPGKFPTPYTTYLPFQVKSDIMGAWSLLMEIPDLRDGTGRLLVPAKQILYRVNGSLWVRASGTPQIIYAQTGPTATGSTTTGWEELRLEFKLELLGNEPAGKYTAQTFYSALAQP